jgi:hypothetical protein
MSEQPVEVPAVPAPDPTPAPEVTPAPDAAPDVVEESPVEEAPVEEVSYPVIVTEDDAPSAAATSADEAGFVPQTIGELDGNLNVSDPSVSSKYEVDGVLYEGVDAQYARERDAS